jgi:hypothetical protein
MASTVATYGTFSAQKLQLKNQLEFMGANDDNNTIVIECAEPTGPGFKYSLEALSQNRTILHDGNVSTYVDALPTGTTPGDMVVYDGANYQAVQLSGDVQVAGNGASTIQAGAVDNNKISGSANIDYAKLNLANQIQNSDIAPGAGIEKAKLAQLNIVDADIDGSANINQNKLNLDITTNEINANANIAKTQLAPLNLVNSDVDASAAIDGSKIDPNFGAQDVRTTGHVEAGQAEGFYIGSASTDGSWRMVLNGTDFEFQRREAGSWVTKSQVAA